MKTFAQFDVRNAVAIRNPEARHSATPGTVKAVIVKTVDGARQRFYTIQNKLTNEFVYDVPEDWVGPVMARSGLVEHSY